MKNSNQNKIVDVTKATGRDIYRKQLDKELLELIDPETGIVSFQYADYISCPICDKNDAELLFNVKGYPHVRCRECNMVYANPQVKQENLKKLYTQKSTANDLWIDVLLSDSEKDVNNKLYDDYLMTLEELTSERHLVDVGCSIGDFMLQASKRGWKTEGVDLSKKAVQYAKEVRELDVRLCKIEEAGYPESSIPVLIMTGVLEHLNDPRGFLNMIKNYLKPGGLILFQVPNLHSIANMILQEKSTSFDGRNHLHVFSVETLTELCRRVGLKVEFVKTDIFPSHSLGKYLGYMDPYEAPMDFSFLPKLLQPYFTEEKKHNLLSETILKMDMGQRITLIARRA
ncbi:MAG: class I SAM-dependent methyltransferase [Desulfobacterales bacterium]|nr:class I SAM-dependent methyltransferase [Desulfobacterales bacterium]